jgi:tetratricopeptide (TPR) repeat protein
MVSDSSPDALMRSGLAFCRSADFAAAAQAFRMLLDQEPEDAAARVNLANALWSAGRLDAAEVEAGAAVSTMPALAEAWIILGAIRLDRGLARQAVEAYAEACRLKPHAVAALAGLGAAHLAAGQPEAARDAAAAALALDPGHSHAATTLGAAMAASGAPDAAIAIYDKVLEAHPGRARVHLNRGNAWLDLDRPDMAEPDIRKAIAFEPGLKEAHASLGFLLTLRGDLQQALAACETALALDADFAVAHWNLGVAALLDGDFTRGFSEYEWRKRHPVFGRAFIRGNAPEWTGEPLAGRHLLVRAEQGLGDTIMLARFLPDLAARAGRVTLQCAPCLMPLLRQLGTGLVPSDALPPAHDYALDQMSLPHLLRLSPAVIPVPGGYLQADPARARHWRAILPRCPAMKRVGLIWAGNPLHHNDRRRSLPAGALQPLLDLPDIQFVSLQLGARAGEYPVLDLAPLLKDFGETAAVVAELDALVTVDSAVAHLAGAMGVPCHVLLSAAVDWRWQLNRQDTPWYTSMTLHRQEALGDWSKPMAGVVAALAALKTQPCSAR